MHAKLETETLRTLLNELIERVNELEDESQPLQTITIAFHPAFEQGETD